MNTSPIVDDTLRNSVIAVPPLARNGDYSLNRRENERLVRHLEAGGVSTVLYGGNANLYHVALSEYRVLLQMIGEIGAPDTLVIPSVGPAYGTMMDQAKILLEFPFPTVMVLPHNAISTSAGIARAVQDFVQLFQRPVILYIKAQNYVSIGDVYRMMNDGALSAIKYAIVRADPGEDVYLRALIDTVGPQRIVSGMGEQPAIIHMRDFGLAGFTSGCVCIRPDLSMRMLRALRQCDYTTAESIRRIFQPLEDLRNKIHPIRVLHAAVAGVEIADTGPLLPSLSDLDASDRALVADVAVQLKQWNGG